MSDIRSQIKNSIVTLMKDVVFPSPVNGQLTWMQISRRLMMFNKIDPSNQPACFVVQHRENYTNSGMGTPAIRILDVGLWCFAPSGSDDIVGDELLDSMLAGIEAILTVPDNVMTNELTLGGLVNYVKIDRRDNMLIRDPGDIDGQALLVVPLRIMMP